MRDRTRFRYIPLLSLLLWALAACPAMAAESGQVSLQRYQQELEQPLSLDQAIREALENNTAIRRARARVDERRGKRRHASRWVPSNPQLQVTRADRSGPAGDFSDLGIRLSQPLWIGGEGGLRERAAEARLRSAEAQLRYLETAHAARTREAFLSLLWARESVATAQRMVEVNQEFADFAERRLEAGETTAMAVNSATIGLRRAQAELASARNRRQRQRLALAERLSRDISGPLRIEGELEPWTLDLPSDEELVSRAVSRRQDLVAAGEAVEAAREELRLSRRQLIPDLTVFGLYEEEADFEVRGGGVTLELPLLHHYGGEREAARARLQQRQLAEDELQLTVRREVRRALADYRAAAERVALLGEQTLQQAQENVNLLQQAFDAGEVGAPAITSAQDNLMAVRRSYLQALRELIDAVTALERATGGLVTVSNTAGAGDSGTSNGSR